MLERYEGLKLGFWVRKSIKTRFNRHKIGVFLDHKPIFFQSRLKFLRASGVMSHIPRGCQYHGGVMG